MTGSRMYQRQKGVVEKVHPCSPVIHWQPTVEDGQVKEEKDTSGYLMHDALEVYMPLPAISCWRRPVFGLSILSCMIKYVSTTSYTPLDGTSPNVKRTCRLRQR